MRIIHGVRSYAVTDLLPSVAFSQELKQFNQTFQVPFGADLEQETCQKVAAFVDLQKNRALCKSISKWAESCTVQIFDAIDATSGAYSRECKWIVWYILVDDCAASVFSRVAIGARNMILHALLTCCMSLPKIFLFWFSQETHHGPKRWLNLSHVP